MTVGYLPKDIVNQYFAAAKTGVDKAAGELGGTVTQVGPNEAKADLQIPFITDLTTQGVDAIIISADGKDEVAPALKEAMAKPASRSSASTPARPSAPTTCSSTRSTSPASA